jgi:lysophospholipase L1-like esterase
MTHSPLRVASACGVVLLCALTAACAPTSTTTAQPPKRLNYVAIGDSAAAAPLVPDAADPPGCMKSTNNYPSVLARRLGATGVVDVTCSGATTDDVVYRSQQTRDGPVAPQIEAVRSETVLITITIGGNDVGLARDAARCRRTSLGDPPCRDELVSAAGDRISEAITTQVAAWAEMIDAVRAKAPTARIILVGYGTYIRPGGCFPDEPVNPLDADYFQSKINEIDDRQRELAAGKGVEYFDTRPLSVGHDMCAAVNERYFEGFTPINPAAPLHPNALGSAATGNALADQIN